MNAPDKPLLGIRHDIPIEQYHRGAGISKSGLDLIDQSPLHYFAEYLDPRKPAKEESSSAKAAHLVGNLAHCALLEPAEFDRRYIVGPDVNKNTNVWKDFVKLHADKTVIGQDQRDAAMRQADSMRALPQVRDALAKGHPEVSAYWIDEETGELCRCRPDWVSPVNDGAVVLLDVKTYSNASPVEFARQVARMRYHLQAAYYTDGFEFASGAEVLAFVFVAVEVDWPHAATAVMLDDAAIDQGRRDYRRNLNTYAQCRKTNVWPGYSDKIELVTLPRWAFDKE